MGTCDLKMVLAIVAVIHLTACSKTVQWEEEVPLNTGQVIWVKRTVEYTMQGGAGNPFDTACHPKRGGSRTAFTWTGKTFEFDLDVGVVLIAISPNGYPVVMAEGRLLESDRRRESARFVV